MSAKPSVYLLRNGTTATDIIPGSIILTVDDTELFAVVDQMIQLTAGDEIRLGISAPTGSVVMDTSSAFIQARNMLLTFEKLD